MSFQSLGLSQPVLQALAFKGYSEATPIQTQAIPTVLKGRDLLGIAQTGTGKTAAFMLPSIDRLAAGQRRASQRACRMLVLAPTRELAGQIADSGPLLRPVRRHARRHRVRRHARSARTAPDVARGVDVLVATPGRLIDLVEQGALTLREVEILVLDEADQMLDLGFIHALKQIVKMLPAKRQTLFFSATMPKAIKELADKFLTDPAQVSVAPAGDHRRAGRSICHLRPAGGEAGAAHHDAAPRLLRARQYGPGADLHPHQAWRRPGGEAARRQRHRLERDPRQQEPAAARARAGRVQAWPGRRS